MTALKRAAVCSVHEHGNVEIMVCNDNFTLYTKFKNTVKTIATTKQLKDSLFLV